MSTITTTVPGISTTLFAVSQTVVAGDFVVFNGTSSGNTAVFGEGGYMRTISFTSADNLAGDGVTFTVIGISNGASVTETVTAPNANTVYSAKAYSSITSIQVNVDDATTLTVGSGTTTVVPYSFTQRVNTTNAPVNNSFGIYFNNPDSVNVNILGTYRPITDTEILAAMASTSNGVFTVSSSITAAHQAVIPGMQSVYCKVTSSGSAAMSFDIYTF